MVRFVQQDTLSSSSSSEIVIEPWDWRYYTDKIRKQHYDFDNDQLKPFFSLDRMVEAVFDCAYKLFGLTFVLRSDIISYHPDVKTYNVFEAAIDGEPKLIAIFMHDNFSRPYKQSGAWMSAYRTQTKNTDSGRSEEIPIIVNNNNFNKGMDGMPSLLSFDDAVTLFHEFGHALHGMLSDVTYRRLSGTSVLRDFVELPSQLYEHWLSEPEVLKKHAKHYITNEPISEYSLQKLFEARKFNQAFGTIEYTACALLDISLHSQVGETLSMLDLVAFERDELKRLDMPKEIVMRHRPAHFLRKGLKIIFFLTVNFNITQKLFRFKIYRSYTSFVYRSFRFGWLRISILRVLVGRSS
jgi:peptidyl-dipeptidase Dcp